MKQEICFGIDTKCKILFNIIKWCIIIFLVPIGLFRSILVWIILSYLWLSIAISGPLYLSLVIFDYLWLSRSTSAVSVYLGLSLAISGYLCLTLVLSGYHLQFLAISGYIWLSLANPFNIWLSEAIFGCLSIDKINLDKLGYLGLSWAISGYLWLSQAISGYLRQIS